MIILRWPLIHFQSVVQRLAAGDRNVFVTTRRSLRKGVRLVRPWSSDDDPRDGGSAIEVRLSEPAALVSAGLVVRTEGMLILGSGEFAGRFRGAMPGTGSAEPIARIDLVGAGLHRVQSGQESNDKTVSASSRLRWSRTIGALGGEAVWERLTRLHVGVVGCGRSGSLLAADLARLGVRRLTLIDPDILEMSNLGEMELARLEDVGQPKARVLATRLRAWDQDMDPLPVEASIGDRAGRRLASDCDVLVCGVDNDSARLLTALTASREHLVHLDVGASIRFPGSEARTDEPGPRSMGADVRLIVPGDGCILCRGGSLARYAQAVEESIYGREPRPRDADAWRSERAGSLASLNHVAAGIGVQMLLDLVAERITGTTWAQIEADDMGRFSIEHPIVERARDDRCPVCSRAGLGSDDLG